MYYKMTGSSAKLDQCNTCFAVLVGILLGQTPVIGGGGRYDRAAGRDIKQTCREVARARHIERRLLQLGHSRAVLNEPKFSKKNPKFQILGTCTQAFLQMFSELLERSWARKNSTGSVQILEPISTFPKYLCEGRHG